MDVNENSGADNDAPNDAGTGGNQNGEQGGNSQVRVVQFVVQLFNKTSVLGSNPIQCLFAGIRTEYQFFLHT